MENKGEIMGKLTNLKSLANLAKQRLRNKDYSATQISNSINHGSNSYFLKNIATLKKLSANTEFITISNTEDVEFVKKVIDLIQSNIDLNPISKLKDANVYDNLSDIEKQAYILKLSERYNNVKSNIDNLKNVSNL